MYEYTIYQFSSSLSDLVNKDFLIVREKICAHKKSNVPLIEFEYIFGNISDKIKLEQENIIIPCESSIYSANLKEWTRYDLPIKIQRREAEFLFKQLNSNNSTIPTYNEFHTSNAIPFLLLMGEEVSKYFNDNT